MYYKKKVNFFTFCFKNRRPFFFGELLELERSVTLWKQRTAAIGV